MSEPLINGMTFDKMAHYLSVNYDQRTEQMSMESRILEVLHSVRALALTEAIEEVQGWRSLTIKAHNECKYIDPKEALREVKNKLNLLGVIESKLRTKSGQDPIKVFKDMKIRSEQQENLT